MSKRKLRDILILLVDKSLEQSNNTRNVRKRSNKRRQVWMFCNVDSQIIVFRASCVKVQGRDILTHGPILTKIALTGRLLKEKYLLLLLHPRLRQYSIRPFSNIRDILITKLNLFIHATRMDKILFLQELHPPRINLILHSVSP